MEATAKKDVVEAGNILEDEVEEGRFPLPKCGCRLQHEGV